MKYINIAWHYIRKVYLKYLELIGGCPAYDYDIQESTTDSGYFTVDVYRRSEGKWYSIRDRNYPGSYIYTHYSDRAFLFDEWYYALQQAFAAVKELKELDKHDKPTLTL